MSHFTTAISKYFDFSGRASRAEFWWFTLIMALINITASILDEVFSPGGVGVLYLITAVFFFFPSLAVTVRRLHDTDRGAVWILIALIPIIGTLVFLYFMLSGTMPETNRFGPSPYADGDDYRISPVGQAPREPGFSARPLAPVRDGVPIDQLEKINALRQAGAITEEEFASMKRRILQV
ncbi:DUF805 domain-containing protein [Kaistia sp. UC242_56]|uniref:DUF805 domain-containing protein n=1 Tax=Kaistia sp. UC242_56 TaxID=3374625 RepID=UPI0037A761F1